MHTRAASIHPVNKFLARLLVPLLWVITSAPTSPPGPAREKPFTQTRDALDEKTGSKAPGARDDIARVPEGPADTTGCAHQKAAHKTRSAGFTQRGTAIWYGRRFNGRRTASGEVFDVRKLTAAHPTLPFNTRVRVSNLDNGTSVVVRINDRGPFNCPHCIDLSLAAARRIGIARSGSAHVLIRALHRQL